MEWSVTLQEATRESRALNYLDFSLFLQFWAPSLRDDDAHSWIFFLQLFFLKNLFIDNPDVYLLGSSRSHQVDIQDQAPHDHTSWLRKLAQCLQEKWVRHSRCPGKERKGNFPLIYLGPLLNLILDYYI